MFIKKTNLEQVSDHLGFVFWQLKTGVDVYSNVALLQFARWFFLSVVWILFFGFKSTQADNFPETQFEEIYLNSEPTDRR